MGEFGLLGRDLPQGELGFGLDKPESGIIRPILRQFHGYSADLSTGIVLDVGVGVGIGIGLSHFRLTVEVE